MSTQAEYIEVDASVRYWEDATVNGADDVDGSLIPHRQGGNWKPKIRLKDGLVLGWPNGTQAEIHYKVCDAGQYWLLDGSRKRIAKWCGWYVPDEFLCHGEKGYGDYIILNVNGFGFVEGWREPRVVMDDGEDGDSVWKAI